MWCVEGRCEGRKPKYSRVCPGKAGNRTCDCSCHTPEAAAVRFKRRRGASSEDGHVEQADSGVEPGLPVARTRRNKHQRLETPS